MRPSSPLFVACSCGPLGSFAAIVRETDPTLFRHWLFPDLLLRGPRASCFGQLCDGSDKRPCASCVFVSPTSYGGCWLKCALATSATVTTPRWLAVCCSFLADGAAVAQGPVRRRCLVFLPDAARLGDAQEFPLDDDVCSRRQAWAWNLPPA